MSGAIVACAVLLAMSGPTEAAPRLQVGVAKLYSPGLMERVAAKRGLRLPAGYAGFASVQECDYRGRKDAMIGRTVYASIRGGPVLRYMVADCSHPRDRARHKRTGLVIEVSYATAQRQGWARAGKTAARVWSQ